jgi:hypothetical protein
MGCSCSAIVPTFITTMHCRGNSSGHNCGAKWLRRLFYYNCQGGIRATPFGEVIKNKEFNNFVCRATTMGTSYNAMHNHIATTTKRQPSFVAIARNSQVGLFLWSWVQIEARHQTLDWRAAITSLYIVLSKASLHKELPTTLTSSVSGPDHHNHQQAAGIDNEIRRSRGP